MIKIFKDKYGVLYKADNTGDTKLMIDTFVENTPFVINYFDFLSDKNPEKYRIFAKYIIGVDVNIDKFTISETDTLASLMMICDYYLITLNKRLSSFTEFVELIGGNNIWDVLYTVDKDKNRPDYIQNALDILEYKSVNGSKFCEPVIKKCVSINKYLGKFYEYEKLTTSNKYINVLEFCNLFCAKDCKIYITYKNANSLVQESVVNFFVLILGYICRQLYNKNIQK